MQLVERRRLSAVLASKSTDLASTPSLRT